MTGSTSWWYCEPAVREPSDRYFSSCWLQICLFSPLLIWWYTMNYRWAIYVGGLKNHPVPQINHFVLLTGRRSACVVGALEAEVHHPYKWWGGGRSNLSLPHYHSCCSSPCGSCGLVIKVEVKAKRGSTAGSGRHWPFAAAAFVQNLLQSPLYGWVLEVWEIMGPKPPADVQCSKALAWSAGAICPVPTSVSGKGVGHAQNMGI